ncbi:fimbrillin family protein [Parabacteroides sp. OttesenSCG-928-G07]|nr:fimbrillin family protein [Parabacteroides sp. OttesenSCG-928-G07]
MRKSYVWIVAIIGMATALAGCSKDNDSDWGGGAEENVEIRAKSKALSLEVSTKAPFEGTISSSNTLTARVLTSTSTGDYSSLHSNGKMTFGTNGTDSVAYTTGTDSGFSGSAFYPGDQTLYFAGLYPADTWSNIGTTATYTVDGKSDIMSAAQQSDKKGGNAPTLAFNHLLTKLEISVKADDAAAVDAWGKITDMTLVKISNGNNPNKLTTVTLSTGAATFSSSTTDSIPFYIYDSTTPAYTDNAVAALTETAITIPTTAGKVAYSMVTPVAIAADTDASVTNAYTIALKTTKNTNWTNVPVTITKGTGSLTFTNTAGYSFNITLTFKGSVITAKATVTEWVDGGTGAGDVI